MLFFSRGKESCWSNSTPFSTRSGAHLVSSQLPWLPLPRLGFSSSSFWSLAVFLHTASHQNWTWGRPGNEASPCSVFHHCKILDMAWKWVIVPLVFSGPNFDSCIIICSHIFQVLSSRRIDHDYALYLLLSLPEEHAVEKLQAIRSRNVSSYSKVIVSLLFYSVGATSIAMLHFTDCV